MANPFIAEIIMFGGNFAPRGWAFCNGQLLPIAQNTALFSLIGTIYGGDGRTTTALPDLRGRTPVSAGSGPGLQTFRQGQRGGSETTTLTSITLPSHSHTVTYADTKMGQGAHTGGGDDSNPQGRYPSNSDGEDLYSNSATGTMGAATVNAVTTVPNQGAGQSFSNMQPVLAVNFIIAITGTFPSRS